MNFLHIKFLHMVKCWVYMPLFIQTKLFGVDVIVYKKCCIYFFSALSYSQNSQHFPKALDSHFAAHQFPTPSVCHNSPEMLFLAAREPVLRAWHWVGLRSVPDGSLSFPSFLQALWNGEEQSVSCLWSCWHAACASHCFDFLLFTRYVWLLPAGIMRSECINLVFIYFPWTPY